MKKTLLFPVIASAVAGWLGACAPAFAQDAAAGAKKVDMCIGCHDIPGYQSSFPEVYYVPKIAGQSAKYIVSALGEYKKGNRKFPSMRAIAAALSDQDMADIAAFYEKLGGATTVPATPPAPPADVAKLLEKAACTSCHGKNFSTPLDGYPKLAGQYADYLDAALRAYQTVGNPRIGRDNAIMMGMARPFSHAELKAITNYIASLPSELKTVQLPEFR